MASLLEAVKKALAESDAEPELMKPMSEAELAELPQPIPADLRELLSFCRGWSGGRCDWVDLSGLSGDFGMEALFPDAAAIAGDGAGNFWIVDFAQSWSQLYFACHDPPVIAFQGALQDFLVASLGDGEEEPSALVSFDQAMVVWKKNPGTMSRADCLNSSDAELRAFAAELDDKFVVVDLRNAQPGDGFSWGRYGSDALLRRRGDLPIFAYARR